MKFVIDANGLAPIAEALSGRSRVAGVAAGLRNQMMGAELDKMRFEQDKVYRQQQAQDDLLNRKMAALFPQLGQREREDMAHSLGGSQPARGFKYNSDGSVLMGDNGQPVFDTDVFQVHSELKNTPQWQAAQNFADAVGLTKAYGLEGKEAVGVLRQSDEDAYIAKARDLALNARSWDELNQALALLNGKPNNVYSSGSNGTVLNTSSGQLDESGATAQANIFKNVTDGYNNQASAGHKIAQTEGEYANTALTTQKINREATNIIGQSLSNAEAAARLYGGQKPSQTYKPLPNGAVESVFGTNSDAYNSFRAEMIRDGYADENEYYPVWVRKGIAGGQIGAAVAKAGMDNMSPTAKNAADVATAAKGAGAPLQKSAYAAPIMQRYWGGDLRGGAMPAANKADLNQIRWGLRSQFGFQIDKAQQGAFQAVLQKAVESGEIDGVDAKDLWTEFTGEK